jgi:hypothetical protein
MIFDFIFSKEMAHDVFSATLGCIIAVFWAKQVWKKEQSEQSKLLRKNLIKAFRGNLGGIETGLKMLQQKPTMFPNFRLDTSTVGYILFTGRNLFRDETWFEKFNWQRYQLDHINAKLDYLQLILTPQNQTEQSLLQQRYDSVIAHLILTHKEISELIGSFEKANTNEAGA